jgi:hypothetical protein
MEKSVGELKYAPGRETGVASGGKPEGNWCRSIFQTPVAIFKKLVY